MQKSPIRGTHGGVEVDLLIVPNASRSAVIGLHGDRVKIKVASPPEKGRANAAVIDLLKATCGAKRVEITHGRTGRHKTARLSGVDLEAAQAALTKRSDT